MAAVAILDFGNLTNLTAIILRRTICIAMQNFIEIGQAIAEKSQFLDISQWRPPPTWISKKIKFLTAGGFRRLIMCYGTKFRVNRRNRWGDIAIGYISK